MTNNLDTLSLDNLINPNLNDETNFEPVIVIIPPGAQTDNIFEKEVESLEQQALKLRFIQELNEAAEKKNKEIGLPKKNNETNLDTEQNVMQDKAAIRLYSKAKIDEIIHILQNPPKTTTDDRNRVNKYYYCRTTFYLTATEPVQLAKLEKKDQDRVHPRIVVAVEDMFEKCMEIHKNIGYQGTAGMSKEANKFYYNITRPIMTIFLKYSKDYQLK